MWLNNMFSESSVDKQLIIGQTIEFLQSTLKNNLIRDYVVYFPSMKFRMLMENSDQDYSKGQAE